MDTLEKEWELLMSEHVDNISHDYSESMDIRGEPTTVCPCGSKLWLLKVMFDDDGEISMWFTETMECVVCGTLATAPHPSEEVIDE
jgi:hypothetical protein